MTYLRPLVPHLACLALVLVVAPFAPLAPSAIAIAFPRPCDAPVTMADWPDRSTFNSGSDMELLAIST